MTLNSLCRRGGRTLASLLLMGVLIACAPESDGGYDVGPTPDVAGDIADVSPPPPPDATAPGAPETGGGSHIIDPPSRRDAGSDAPPSRPDAEAPTDITNPVDTLDDAVPPDEDISTTPGCPDYTKDPVLMVHGFGANAEITWMTIRSRLVEDCWPPEFLYAPEFDDLMGCNPAHGEDISRWVQELKRRTGRDKVDILAFSMGSMDARYYIKHLCGYRHVRDFVSLAGANHGSTWGCSVLVSHTCGGQQLCRGSEPEAWRDNPFLADLNACDETPGDDILYTSIWSRLDGIVVPGESAILDGALNVQMSHPYDHASMFLEPEPYEWIKVGLDGGGRNDNEPTEDGLCYRACPPGL